MTRRIKQHDASAGKRKRRPPPRSKRKPADDAPLPAPAQVDAPPHSELPIWIDDDGVQLMLHKPLDAKTRQRMNETYQRKIRESPMWTQMVREFGLQKAEELLKQCRIQAD